MLIWVLNTRYLQVYIENEFEIGIEIDNGTFSLKLIFMKIDLLYN